MLLQSITDRVFYLPNEEPTDRPVLGCVRGARHSLLIDAGNSPSHVKRLVQSLQEQHLPLPDLI